MKHIAKWIFIIIAIVAIIYTAMALYFTNTKADINCKIFPAMISPSASKNLEIYQEQTECDDGRLVETKVYLKNNSNNERFLMYEAASKEKLSLYTLWKSDNEIDFYIPLFQERFNERKYDVNLNINYIDLEKDFEQK